MLDTAGVRWLTPTHNAGHDSIPLDQIRAIDFGIDSTLYLGTYGAGLAAIRGDTSWAITRDDSLLDNKVYGMFQQDDTTFYYATSMGLCAYRDSAWVGFQAGAGIPRGEVRRVIPLPPDRMILLVGGGGIYRFDGNSARRLSRDGMFPENGIADITLDAAGNLWAAGRFGGIARYRGGNWTPVAEGDDAVWRSPWRCAWADTLGDVFFGSADGVVLAMMDGNLREIRLPVGLPSGSVRRFCPGADGRVYFLNGARLASVAPGEYRAVFEQLPQPLSDLATSPSGGLWAAGRFGLFQQDGNRFAAVAVDVRARDLSFEALTFDEVGHLWAAARDGALYRYDGVAWLRLADHGELGPTHRLVPRTGGGVWAVAMDPSAPSVSRYRQGGWARYEEDVLGTDAVVDAARGGDGTFYLLRPNELRRFVPAGSDWLLVTRPGEDEVGRAVAPPSGDRFRCVAVDADGGMYLGCGEWVAYAGKRAPRWIRTDELFGARGLSALFVDGSGMLWAGFERDGLARVTLESIWSP
jgi:ligand-binding sensor domain-containing protein